MQEKIILFLYYKKVAYWLLLRDNEWDEIDMIHRRPKNENFYRLGPLYTYLHELQDFFTTIEDIYTLVIRENNYFLELTESRSSSKFDIASCSMRVSSIVMSALLFFNILLRFLIWVEIIEVFIMIR